MTSNVKAVVIDHYGGVCRVGLTGDASPRLTLNPSASESPIDTWKETICTTLGLNPEEYYLLLTDDYNSTTERQQKVAKIVFEKIKVKGLQFAPRAVLPLYAAGQLTGVVVDCAEEDIYIVPVNEGYAVQEAIEKVKPGGADLGKKLYDSVLKCEEGLRQKLLENIVVAGDNPAHADLPQHLEGQLKSAVPGSTKFNIKAPAERAISCWIGGSILSSIVPFQEKWISKEEYGKKGSAIIQEKQISPPISSQLAVKAVVLEIAGGVCRAGLAGASAPTAVFPSKENGDIREISKQAVCSELGLKSEDCCLLLAESYNSSTTAREKFAKILFEALNIQGLQFAPRAVLPLYAAGQLTGVVVDCAEEDIYIVPVNEGYAVQEAIERVKPGDADLGKKLYDSVLKCEEGLRQKLLENIVVAGDNPAHAGLPQNLERQLKSALPESMKFNIKAPAERAISCWIGGSILASILPSKEKWISKEEYGQKGSAIIQEKQLSSPVGHGLAVKAVVLEIAGGVCRAGLAGASAPTAVFPSEKNGDIREISKQAVCTELGLKSEDCRLLLAESYNSSITAREKFAKILFEALNIQGLQFAPRAVLPLYAAGQLTGVVVDCAEEDIYIVPVNEGYAVQEAIERVKPGDADLGKKLYDSILKCEEGLRQKLLENIVVAGDNPAHADLPQSLDRQLKPALPSGTKFNIKAPAERAISCWIGGSILASILPFKEKWISKEEYVEKGSAVIAEKRL